MRSCKKYLLLLGLRSEAVAGSGMKKRMKISRLRLKDRKACLLILKY